MYDHKAIRWGKDKELSVHICDLRYEHLASKLCNKVEEEVQKHWASGDAPVLFKSLKNVPQ